MARLLCVSRNTEQVRTARRLDKTKAKNVCLETMEPRPNPIPRIAGLGYTRMGRTQTGQCPERTLARVSDAKYSPGQSVLEQSRADKPHRTLPSNSSSLVNRRIPNGTYGGVRGRGLTAPSYSISPVFSGKEAQPPLLETESLLVCPAPFQRTSQAPLELLLIRVKLTH